MSIENIPAPHAAFLERALPLLQADHRIAGVAAGGSLISGTMDEYSDLDLVIAVEPAGYDDIMQDRRPIAAGLGALVASFTGEHVGEPRLLICLYDDPPLHVDLKFVSLPDVAVRVEDPLVLWDRDGRLSDLLRTGEARFPARDPQWIEDRFWVWVHYVAVKIGRGELFEAVDGLAFLRGQVLGPLALMEAGARPTGVRRIESMAASRATQLEATISAYDRSACVRCLYAAVDLYRSLRDAGTDGTVVPNRAAEEVAVRYLDDVAP